MEQPPKSYPAPWQGHLLLACKKCQKKLKKSDPLHALANLKKTLKQRNKRMPQNAFFVLNVPCMDVCPKDAVVVCLPASATDRVLLLRSENDLDRL